MCPARRVKARREKGGDPAVIVWVSPGHPGVKLLHGGYKISL